MTRRILSAVAMTLIFASQAWSATFVIQNNDGAGEGFNDPSPPTNANQKGNNPGTTLGELRMNVFQAAADVWGGILNSNVTITVGGSFDELFCVGGSATLGSAGATGSSASFAGSEPNIAYAIALAESLNGSNMNGNSVEISAIFNNLLDSDPACLGGGGFYYGLDDNVPLGTSALFPVVLHEIAHGLGFASMADVGGGAGNFLSAGGYPDSFSRELLDLDNSKSWDEMSNAERLASALNEPELVWEGAQVTADRDEYLGPAPELGINAPAPIAGTFEVAPGQQSAVIPGGGVTAGIVDGNTFDDLGNNPAAGCTQIGFGGTFTGKIVIFDSTPDCSAAVIAFFTELEAAVGLIIADTSGSGLPDMSGLIGNPINIPYIGVEKSVADDLRANLATANVSLQNSASRFLGENQGKVKMYAPAIFEEGSSVSHWSTTASPNLLMEPILSNLDFAEVDLTAAAFSDMGWSVNLPGAPAIDIRKNAEGADSQQVVVGQDASFTIRVENTGDVVLTNVVISDPLVPDCDSTFANLAVDEVQTYTCTVTVSEDFTNVANASGDDPNSDPVTDSDPSSVDAINPSIDIRKNAEGADSQQVVVGQDASFTIRVENTGDVVLTNVVISDPLVPDCDSTFANLAVDEVQTYTCTVTVSEDFTNVANASGDDPNSDPVTDSDPSSVDAINPSIDIRKNAEGADSQQVVVGQDASFTIRVENTGDVVLTNVVISDPLVPDCDSTFASMAVDEVQTYTCTVTVSEDFTNVANASGDDPNSDPVTDSDPSSVDAINPSIDISKNAEGADSQQVVVGQDASFTIRVENTGDVVLTNVVISDPLVPDCDSTFASMAVDEVQTYTCTVTVSEDFTNVANASGEDPNSDQVTDSDPSSVDAINPEPLIFKDSFE